MSRLRFERGIAVVLALFVVSACGEDDNQSATTAAATVVPASSTATASPDSQPDATDVSTSSEPAESTPAPALSGEPVKIGVILPLSGSFATFGQSVKAGQELWASTIGATEGILGRPVEMIFRDDKGETATAVTVARRLIDEDDVDLAFTSLSVTAPAITPLFAEAGIPHTLIGGLSALSDPTQNPLTFTLTLRNPDNVANWLQWACDLGVTQVGAIAPNIPVGVELMQAIKDTVGDAACPLELVDTQEFDAEATDMTSQVASLQDSGAQAIFSAANTPGQHSSIYRSLSELDFHPWYMGNVTAGSNAAVEGLDPDVQPKILPFGSFKELMTPLPDETQTFSDGLFSTTSAEPGATDPAVSAWGYSALEILRQGSNGAGTTEGAAVAEWLEAGNEVCSGVYPCMTFSPDLHLGIAPSAEYPSSAGQRDANGWLASAPEVAELKTRT